MNCDWEEHGMPDERGWRTVRCTRCRFIMPPTPHTFDRIHRECPYVGLGDYVAHGLAAFGITKERVAWALGKSDCISCQERQESLNELGKKIGL